MGVIDEVVQVVEVLVTKHLRYDFNQCHEKHQDDQGYGEFVVKHHAVGSVLPSPAKLPNGLSPPDPLLVQRRPHLHLVQRHQQFNEKSC